LGAGRFAAPQLASSSSLAYDLASIMPPESLAFVPQYCYDLFISYAHGDEAPPVRWVSRFKGVLGTELGQRLGRPPAIWFDTDRLQTGFQLDERVRYDLERTAVLLRLTSPFYNHSGYCAREREWFDSPTHPLDPPVVDSQSRCLVCVLRPDPDHLPDLGAVYATMHNAEGAPFDPEGRAIQRAATSLAAAIEGLLRRMAARRPLVYVPYAGPDVEPHRKRLMADLHAEGYRTGPRPNEPFQQKKVVDDLRDSPLAVFLLGCSFVPDHRHRLRVASEGSKPVIVWIDPDAEMDSAQVEFADSLINNPPGELLRHGSVQDLIQTARKRLWRPTE
jgi:hypothetical protein